MEKEKEKAKTMTKADRVRKYMQSHPDARPKDVESALKRHGITAQYVSVVKLQDKQRNGGEAVSDAAPTVKRGRRPNAAKSGALSGETLVAAAKLIEACGGASNAQHAIQTAEKIAAVIR